MKQNAVSGFLAGAAVMYLADPTRGRRRRAMVRDRLVATCRDVTNELDKAERDLWNRTCGFGASLSSRWKGTEADGPVLVERVRSAIGRAVSHPHAICVHSEGNGRVVLDGPVLRHEVDYLLRHVSAVPGVKEAVNRLDIHTDAASISSLQGGVPRRALSELAQERWTPSLRVASAAFAGTMVVAGTRADGAPRWIGAIGGALLLVRAITNKPFRQIIGAARGAGVVHFEKTIHIDAPVELVYAYWANFENFPKFMTHLKEVRHLKNGRSHWVAAGPAGLSIPWDAEITAQQANRLLAWTSVPGSMVRTAGMVRFDSENQGRTRVQIRMSYCPPAGLFGHSLAWLFGADPKTEMDADLVRLKSLLETGRTRAHHVPVTRDEVAIATAQHQQQAW